MVIRPWQTGRRARMLAWVAAALLAGHASPSRAQIAGGVPKGAERADVLEHLDAPVPLELAFVDEAGAPVVLGQYFRKGHPVLLSLNYYSCPMLCTLQLNGLVSALKQLDWLPGREFEIVTVSINPKEGPELASQKKQSYLQHYGRMEAGNGWHFLTGRQDEITALAEAVGFKYEYDATTGQYAHAAVAYLVTPEGRLSRYLYGVQFDPRTLRYSLVEASAGRIGNTLDRLILLCFHYDAAQGRYAPAAMNVMRIGGGVTAAILAAFLFRAWRRESRRRRAAMAGIKV